MTCPTCGQSCAVLETWTDQASGYVLTIWRCGPCDSQWILRSDKQPTLFDEVTE